MERQKELSLVGKVAIVTGASRGVGRLAAINFARRGAKVVLAARTVDPDPALPGSLGELLHDIESLGAEALVVQTDLARQSDLKRLIDETVARFGGVDVLVNNAASTVGSVWEKKFHDLTFAEWTNDFDINLHAPFTLMQLAAPIMAARGGGRIVNVTTGSGEVFRMPEEHVPPSETVGRNLVVPSYFASKRALDRLSNVIAPELRKDDVYVIGMHPGWVATEIVTDRLKKANFDPKEGDNRPVPTDIPARMIVYFASCEDPNEYTGRLFWAEREMADMGVPFDPTDTEGVADIQLAETKL